MKSAYISVLLSTISITIANSAPTITCPGDSTVPCNSPAQVTVTVADPAGSALGIYWAVNGTSVQTNGIPAGQTVVPTNVTFSAILPFGTNSINVMATDGTNVATCTATVTVIDTNPPVITLLRAAPTVLWPPNHQMKTISVHADVVDDCSATTWSIISVSSNEADDIKGSGHTSPDWQIIGAHALKVRAERSGHGSGRIYTITAQAMDEAGNLSEPKSVTVTVPHDKGKGNKGSNGNGNSAGNGNGNNGNGNNSHGNSGKGNSGHK